MRYDVTPGTYAELRWVGGTTTDTTRELIPEGSLSPLVTRDGVEWLVREFRSKPHARFILVPPPSDP